MQECLRKFDGMTKDMDCSTLTGRHSNCLFYNCRFDKLNDLTLEGCDLNHSEFITSRVRDALGFTLTLDCNSFGNVRYSELLFDLMLCLLTSTVGNDEKREKLKAVVGQARYESLMRIVAREE